MVWYRMDGGHMSITANRQVVLPPVSNDIEDNLKDYFRSLGAELLANQRQVFDSLLFLFESVTEVANKVTGFIFYEGDFISYEGAGVYYK